MKLFLLDAYALIYRSYYAFIKSPRINSKGQNTSAIFGFVNTLEDVLRKENPTHIGIGFDPPGPTFRHKLYEQYKALRQETPEVIRESVPIIKEIIKAYNIPLLEVSGFEADDVIGTLAKKASKEGFDVYMMTPDKDYAQLVEDHIFIYKPKYGSSEFEILGVQEVLRKYELKYPQQVIDLLGLMGDKSDNIPGCPGVGEKTAQKLIADYGIIENILDHTLDLKGALQEKLEKNKDTVLFSKFLATIRTDVPIEFDPQTLKREKINEEKLKEIFNELEFRNLVARILGEDKRQFSPAPKNTPSQGFLFPEFEAETASESFHSNLSNLKSTPHTYKILQYESEKDDFIGKMYARRLVSFDTETTGLDPLTSELVGMSFAVEEGEAFYLPVPENFEEAKKLVEQFKSVLESDKVLKVGQNIKYDIIVLKKYGIDVKGPLFDTMIAHYLMNPELRHNMDYLAETYLDYETIHIEELIGTKGKNQLNMRQVPVDIVSDYASEDADITLKLKNIFEKKIAENNLNQLFYDIEMPLVKVLADMETVGVRLDVDALKISSQELTAQLFDLETEICEMAGMEFNINSAKQVGEILFDRMKIVEKPKKTKTGQYTTSEDILESLRSRHPIVGKLLEHRGLKKLLSTYIDALPSLINPDDGKIHTTFNQTVTATGRLSSTSPNLQNIPIRDAEGKEIRRAFIPDHGCVFFSADYSQIELRIMAHLSGDQNMIDAFISGHDIHAATAAKIYKIPIEDVTKDMRRKAKTANFGIIYGISVFGLADRLAIPRSEAKELIDGYFETYPDVKKYMDESIEIARRNGYVETIFHRKRFLTDISSRNAIVRGYAERTAINAPIQGSAADIIKVAMVRIYNRFQSENIESQMILQVHDELNFNVLHSELEKVRGIVITEMENAFKLRIPVVADCGVGENWLEAH
ncbi:MAG: DNA polymerase I [Dysgonamonadaceae bacterium]|jgi:DNA polymerase-1|nr:DNA polymerase I [Dysgonamonadaceae bacterium]